MELPDNLTELQKKFVSEIVNTDSDDADVLAAMYNKLQKRNASRTCPKCGEKKNPDVDLCKKCRNDIDAAVKLISTDKTKQGELKKAIMSKLKTPKRRTKKKD